MTAIPYLPQEAVRLIGKPLPEDVSEEFTIKERQSAYSVSDLKTADKYAALASTLPPVSHLVDVATNAIEELNSNTWSGKEATDWFRKAYGSKTREQQEEEMQNAKNKLQQTEWAHKKLEQAVIERRAAFERRLKMAKDRAAKYGRKAQRLALKVKNGGAVPLKIPPARILQDNNTTQRALARLQQAKDSLRIYYKYQQRLRMLNLLEWDNTKRVARVLPHTRKAKGHRTLSHNVKGDWREVRADKPKRRDPRFVRGGSGYGGGGNVPPSGPSVSMYAADATSDAADDYLTDMGWPAPMGPSEYRMYDAPIGPSEDRMYDAPIGPENIGTTIYERAPGARYVKRPATGPRSLRRATPLRQFLKSATRPSKASATGTAAFQRRRDVRFGEARGQRGRLHTLNRNTFLHSDTTPVERMLYWLGIGRAMQMEDGSPEKDLWAQRFAATPVFQEAMAEIRRSYPGAKYYPNGGYLIIDGSRVVGEGADQSNRVLRLDLSGFSL